MTDGLEAVLARARDAAGNRLRCWAGQRSSGSARGGLLDEPRLHVVHIVLGGGTALFGGLDPTNVTLGAHRG